MKVKLNTSMLAGAVLLAGMGIAAAQTNKIQVVSSEGITGSDLWDYHGNQIGTIERVLLQPNGKGVFVVIDPSTMLDEDRKLAIPWQKLAVKIKEGADDSGAALDADNLVFSLDATKEKLQGAPVYKTDGDAGLFDASQARPIYQYWEVEFTDRDRSTSDRTRPGVAPRPGSTDELDREQRRDR